MKRISLIGTAHKERGLANVPGLLAILERIQPAIIFLEVAPGTIDDFVARSNLECTAAKRYREKHNAELVPVDPPTSRAISFQDSELLFDALERSLEYRADYYRLAELIEQHTRADGFDFLNSDKCFKLWSAIREAERKAVQELDLPAIRELYELWNRTHELRELGMMKNVVDYCRQNSFEKAAFLIGSAHRQSMMDKSTTQPGVDPASIRWDFDGFLGRAVAES